MKYLNTPAYLDYKNKANELFMVGLYQLFDLKFSYNELNFRYSQKLAICNSNLQQCCELYLKSMLCEKSPYLLIRDSVEIDNRKNLEKSIELFYKNLPTLNNKSILDYFTELSLQQRDFSDCFTIESKKLINDVTKLYGASYFSSIYNFNFRNFYDANRDKRNIFMHSHQENIVDYNELVLNYIAIFDIFNKKSLIKILYKDMLKQVFNREDNPISDPFHRSEWSKKTILKDQKNRNNPWLNHKSISLSKKSVTCNIRYSLMRFIEIIFNSLGNANNRVFFGLYEDFKKNDNSFYCPYCEDYYRASAEDKDSILHNKNSVTLFETLPNVHNLFNYDGFFKSFYPVEKGSNVCSCLICGVSKKIEYSGNCTYCVKNGLDGKTYFLNNKCITCGCSLK